MKNFLTTKRIISSNLNYLLSINKLTKTEISTQANIDRKTLDTFLHGVRVPSIEQLFSLAKVFSVDFMEFISVPLKGDNILREEMSARYRKNSSLVQIDYDTALLFQHDSTKDFWYSVDDDSMDPLFKKGDILICSKVDGTSDKLKPYIITTDTGLIAGYITINTDTLKVVRVNKGFLDISLKIQEVDEVFVIVKCFKLVHL